MSKKKKNKGKQKNKKREKTILDPVHQAIFSQAPSEKFGQGYVTGYWKAVFLLLTFIPYAFLLLDSSGSKWFSLSFSILLVILFTALVQGFNKDMAYNINPFDYVTFQFINFICFSGHFAFIYYTLDLLYPSSFVIPDEPADLIDYFILSFGTVTTAGSKLEPNETYSKIVNLLQLAIGIWYFVTIIPVTIGYQAERLREFNLARKKTFEELDKAVKEGRFKEVPLEELKKKK
ncbi:MAG: hypothetical protein ACWA41_06150 [Putridiphycobacter sp.]